MIFLATTVLLLAASGVFVNPAQNEKRQFPPGISFNWGTENLRCVNLSEWLVLEP